MPGPNVGRAEVDVHADLSPFRRELQAAAVLAGRQYGDTLAGSLDSRLRRVSGVLDRFWLSNLRGSRNDFLNFVGTVSLGIERLLGEGIGRAVGGLANVIDNLGTSVARIDSGPTFLLAGGLRQLASLVRGFPAGAVGGIATQVIGLAGGFSVLVSAISIVVTSISSLLGIITALAVGLGGALLGGVTALLPGIAALGVGIGALALGFSKMTKENKAAIAPLSDFFKELRSGVQERLFDGLASQVDSIVDALRPLGPFLDSIVDVFVDWTGRIISEIGPNGPLAGAFETLGTSLPSILNSLLNLLSSASGAIVGLFAAASPAAQRLFDAIGRVVQRFNEWVNSAEGATAVNDFLQRALDLLGQVWSLAGSLGETLRLLFDGAADGASNLIQGLTDIIDRFNVWLGSEEGQQALLEWFDQAVQFARDMWAVIQELVDIFVALDSSINRENLQQFLDFLIGGVEAAGTFIEWMNQINEVLSNVGDAMAAFVESGRTLRGGIIEAFDAMGVAISNFATRASDFLGSLASPMEIAAQNGRDLRAAISQAFSRAGAAITNFVNGARTALNQGATNISNFVTRGRNSFNNLVSGIAGAMGRATGVVIREVARIVNGFNNLVGRVGSAVGRAIAAINRLPAQAGAAVGRLVSAIQRGVSRAVGALGTLAGRAVNAIASLPGRFGTIGGQIMAGLYNGIVAGGNRVLGYVRSLADSVASTFSRLLGIASPSKVFTEFGKDIVDGLIAGIDDGVKRVEDASNSLAGAATFDNGNMSVSRMAEQAVGDSNSRGPRFGREAGSTEITVVTPYANPRLVAQEVMDNLAASGR